MSIFYELSWLWKACGIALAAAAEHGEIQALLHRVAHGHVHAVLHVALAAVERVRRHIADAGGGKLMPRNAQRNGAVCGRAAL